MDPGRQLDEAIVREMRDRVFETPISDLEWSICRKHWMTPAEIAWLKEHDWPISEAWARRQAELNAKPY